MNTVVVDKMELKPPLALYILAVLFILAPFGNILLSLASSGVADWYKPAVLWDLLGMIHWLDWMWLGLLPLSGILFFAQHKTAWMFSVITLCLVLGVNTHRAMTLDTFTDNNFIKLQIAISMFVTFSVLMLSFYYRYPYLDRRAEWFFATAHRFLLKTEVQVVAEKIYEGQTDSISHSGARIHLQSPLSDRASQMKHLDLVLPELQNLKLKCEIVDIRQQVLRVQFVDMDFRQKRTLQSWLKKQAMDSSKSLV